MPDPHVESFLVEAEAALRALDRTVIEGMVDAIAALQHRGGRLFILGVGGSAANASHAVNDFRKICGIEAYAPTDNIAELTARTNDNGWATTFSDWLLTSKFCLTDALLVLSVGGGTMHASPNIASAVRFALNMGAGVLGIVGRKEGAAYQYGDWVLHIPELRPDRVTPFTESFQLLVLHLIVTHPKLRYTP